MDKQSPKVICFGEALIDRLGPLGGDPSVDHPVKDYFGGAPANVACALAKLGADVGFIGRLGDDQIGNDFRKLMLERGINISCLQTDFEKPSRIVLVRRDVNGERSFGGFSGKNFNGFADEEINLNILSQNLSKVASSADWLLLGTIPLAFRSSSKCLWWLIEHALLKQVRIVLDVNWRPIFWDSKLNPDSGPTSSAVLAITPLLEIASLIKLSKEEAIWFFDTDDPSVISKSLPQKPNIVVTNGSLPIRWFMNSFSGETSVISSIVVRDTTGAGDAFTAGLIFQLIQQSNAIENSTEIDRIITFAAACGALVCQAPGAIETQPGLKQVENFLFSNREE
ncbi:carbohydrate kinase [Prochlorococcus sp. MIT 1223]|uniref:carbohydrate kinase family protein n=1 Tax=Prochlorococcus sp. MIT 1223 TaxID=3096217 RepID=UPI002A762AF2|nr:carbohydrate kinase [Prochlorococcus sp. MIT 1223]